MSHILHMEITEENSDVCYFFTWLIHWDRVTHICISKLTNIGSDNGLSPGRRQAIIWTNAGILLIRTLGTNFSEILNVIHAFHSRKCIWKCRLRNAIHFPWPQCAKVVIIHHNLYCRLHAWNGYSLILMIMSWVDMLKKHAIHWMKLLWHELE